MTDQGGGKRRAGMIISIWLWVAGAADVLADVMVWPVPVWAVSVWAVPLSAALASAAAATAAEMAGETAAASLAVRWPLVLR